MGVDLFYTSRWSCSIYRPVLLNKLLYQSIGATCGSQTASWGEAGQGVIRASNQNSLCCSQLLVATALEFFCSREHISWPVAEVVPYLLGAEHRMLSMSSQQNCNSPPGRRYPLALHCQTHPGHGQMYLNSLFLH